MASSGQPTAGAPMVQPRPEGEPLARVAVEAQPMYVGQMGTGAESGLMGASNQALTSSTTQPGNGAQVQVAQAPVVAEAESTQMIAYSAQPLMQQSQVILRRIESDRESKWRVLTINMLPLYNASFSTSTVYVNSHLVVFCKSS